MLRVATDHDGDLHSETQFRRTLDGFALSEGLYSPRVKLRRHDHAHASICIVLAGGYEEQFGCARRREAEPGTLIVHPDGEHHSEVHGSAQVNLLTIEAMPSRREELRALTSTFDHAWHRKDTRFITLAARLCFEARQGDDASSLVVEALIADLLGAVDRTRLAEARGAGWLSRVRERLDEAEDERPTMRQLGELAGVHPVHLARAFRRAFGCSIGEYLRARQVGRAMVLLRNRALRLSEIAYEAGFADQSHMTRAVVAQTGVAPGAWRRRWMR